VHRRASGSDDSVSWDSRSGGSVQRRFLMGKSETFSEHARMGGELGAKKRVRTRPDRIDGRD